LPSPGKLYIVGIGPGGAEQLTFRARQVLDGSEIIMGNNTYLDQLSSFLAGKTVIRSSMGKEVERAQKSIELARDHLVSMVSGGDPGVYGMAGIVLEILERERTEVAWEVVPGVTAGQAAASRLGSPLSGDFVTISLSDLLTPLEVIEQRLKGGFSMGVPVVLYNPKSRGRPHNFALAMGIAGTFRKPNTPIGIVRNAFRSGEEIIVTTLSAVGDHLEAIDMHTVVIVGGEESRIWRNGTDVKGIITPRGYHKKYVY
jgi:precorrin-3B C17-methyltransferase